MPPNAQLAVVVRWPVSNGMNTKGKKQKIVVTTKIRHVSLRKPGLELGLER
jgi:hypothetical protein